jgi:hypothetical protein
LVPGRGVLALEEVITCVRHHRLPLGDRLVVLILRGLLDSSRARSRALLERREQNDTLLHAAKSRAKRPAAYYHRALHASMDVRDEIPPPLA